MNRQILITGGTGFIGKALCKYLLEQSYELYVLTRQQSFIEQSSQHSINYINSLDAIPADTHFKAIINLAGEPLDKSRWTDKVKQKLVDSRVEMTTAVVNLIKRLETKPSVFISGSAIGWYGHQGTKQLNEESDAKPGFAHNLCQQWEQTSQQIDQNKTRLVNVRIGIVLEKDGGPLKALLPSFRLGLGGKIGNGEQYWSWIHRHDLIRLIAFIIENPDISGPVNAVSPDAIPQKDFAKKLALTLEKPCFMPLPSSLARLALGEFADEILLHGQYVYPQRALKHNFTFSYPHLDDAFRVIFQ